MVAKLSLLEVVLFSFLVWRCDGSRDEESATKIIDELIEKVASSLAGNDKCKSVDGLAQGCSITSDCLKITCNVKFGGKQGTLTATTNRCDEPITVTINAKFNDEGIDWTYVFTSGSEVAVPGLAIDVAGVAKAGLFLKTEIKPDEDGMLALKITLEGGTKAGGVSFFPLRMPLVDQKLPVSTEYCDFVRWWLDRNTAERIAMIITALLLILLIITGCCFCCCCCCCRPCKKKKAARVL